MWFKKSIQLKKLKDSKILAFIITEKLLNGMQEKEKCFNPRQKNILGLQEDNDRWVTLILKSEVVLTIKRKIITISK